MAASDAPATLDSVLAASERRGAEIRGLDPAGDVRIEALREDALAYGVRSGLARRAWEIRQMLQQQAPQLDRIFDFNALLMDQNVLPPVLTQANSVVSTEGADTIRITDRVYSIAAQARFVTAAPTWRNYLLTESNYSYSGPDAYLRPRSQNETAAWSAAVREGWTAGTTQADQILNEQLARLKRDFEGMVLYRTLLSQGMVSRPYVAEARYGVTGDGNRVNINERMLRITSMPQLQTGNSWKPIAVPASPVTAGEGR